MISRIAVVGTGLIGASVGLAAKRGGATVFGWDPDRDARGAAVERGAVDACDSVEVALAGADLAVVAAPIAALPAQVAAVLVRPGGDNRDRCRPTKARVVAAGGSPRFVGGHPTMSRVAPSTPPPGF